MEKDAGAIAVAIGVQVAIAGTWQTGSSQGSRID